MHKVSRSHFVAATVRYDETFWLDDEEFVDFKEADSQDEWLDNAQPIDAWDEVDDLGETVGVVIDFERGS